MTRQQKTPRQRAEEQLALAKRAVTRLSARKNALEHDLAEVSRDLTDAVLRRDHAAQHPDLQQNPTSSTATSTGDQTA